MSIYLYNYETLTEPVMKARSLRQLEIGAISVSLHEGHHNQGEYISLLIMRHHLPKTAFMREWMSVMDNDLISLVRASSIQALDRLVDLEILTPEEAASIMDYHKDDVSPSALELPF